MKKVMIKPFSQNKARRGRQIKTVECDAFMTKLALLLLKVDPRPKELPEGDLEIHFVWGMSYYATSDYDNPIKTAQDVIATHYGIDDKRFVGGSQRKVKVKKDEEFIQFTIKKYDSRRWNRFTGMSVTGHHCLRCCCDITSDNIGITMTSGHICSGCVIDLDWEQYHDEIDGLEPEPEEVPPDAEPR